MPTGDAGRGEASGESSSETSPAAMDAASAEESPAEAPTLSLAAGIRPRIRPGRGDRPTPTIVADSFASAESPCAKSRSISALRMDCVDPPASSANESSGPSSSTSPPAPPDGEHSGAISAVGDAGRRPRRRLLLEALSCLGASSCRCAQYATSLCSSSAETRRT